MARRKAWHGDPPKTPDEARRRLLDAACECAERLGDAAGLSDVASSAGVTRQTVYRYFDDAEDLFRSAAALSSGGFLERLRAAVEVQTTPQDRVVECVVFAVTELPKDKHLGPLLTSGELELSSLLGLGFVQEEFGLIADSDHALDEAALDEMAEMLIRLMRSFLVDPGPARTPKELRAFLGRWLAPMIASKLEG